MRWYYPAALLPFGVFIDIVDRILDGRHLFGVLVRHFNAERLLERHHQFYLVERIRAQVVHERCRGRDFRFIHAELLDDNLLYAFFYAGHSHSSAIVNLTVCRLVSSFPRLICLHYARGVQPRQNRWLGPLWATCPFYLPRPPRSTFREHFAELIRPK